ncbi:hypothetical protein DFH06DRAFT_991084, partial [Mycena polygramma]
LNAFYTANSATISTAASALSSAVNLDVKSIENTISTFAETSAVLMKGLDALGSVHPFVGIAVTAFKLVITLDITRRQNNKKVLVVKLQMQDLMTILFQLRHMRDPEEKGPDGTSLKDRMSGLMQAIAKDITACGSACDVYLKKGFLAKTIKSKIYESRLAGYTKMFADHKQEIGFALKVHTALGVDSANKKLDGQDVHLKLIEDKMEQLFRKLDTSRERDVQKFIEDKGGAKACVDNEATLQELVSKSGESLASLDPTHSGNGDLASARKLLNKELAEDVDEAFKKNMKLFDRKLEMQSKQLSDTITSTGDHIISVLSGGAHDKILDPDLQAIWKEQGWKGSVKARHFVLALNDYYTEKFSTVDAAVAKSVAGSTAGSAPPSPLMSPTSPAFAQLELPGGAKIEDDRWALAYITVARLQAILEAVDDDGTGFVSIKEANDFALSRPEGWSLLSWVAFWAAGWHASVTWYKNRIYNLLDAMMGLLQRVKPANVQAADTYFAGAAIQRVELLLRSTRSAPSTVHNDARLTRITDAFQALEEEKLLAQLDAMVYEIDDPTTLRMITGSRRIERYVFPLVYHLLKRHFDIMRLACIHVLDTEEFEQMSTSLGIVFKVVDERTNNLEAIFKATSMNVKEHLGHVAFGMFQLQHGFSDYLRDPINNTAHQFDEEDGFAYADEDLGPDSDDDEETTKAIFARMSTDWLRYDTDNEPVDVYDFETEHPPPATLNDPLDGTWTGKLFEIEDGEQVAYEGIISMVLTRDGEKLSGAADNFYGILDVEGTVAEDRKVVITIDWGEEGAVVCTGQYDPETDTISGLEASDDPSTRPFIFRHTPPDAYRFRYTDAQFTANRARARWGFAIAAAIDQVKRTRMSWPWLKNRFAERRRYMQLRNQDDINWQKLTPYTPLTDDEDAELRGLRNVLPPCDARFYDAQVDFELQKMVTFDRDCASCERHIRDVWHFCIQCMDDRYCDTVDLCSECMDQTVERDTLVHTSSHVMIKSFRRIHDGELAWVIPEARVVAERAKKAFHEAASLLSRMGSSKRSGHSRKSKHAAKTCCCCEQPVSCPCWVCLDCVEEPYICMDCDAKRAPHNPELVPSHGLNHPLVYILDSDPIPEILTTDLRLAELETKMQGLDSKMASLEEKLDTKFASLEAILAGIGDKLAIKN